MQKKGSRFTFDSFDVTKANRNAFEKARRFTVNDNSKPLAIFGGTATGKTHLLYGVKNAIARVLYGEAEQQSKAPAETAGSTPEKKTTKKKSACKNPTAITTDTSAPKKSGGRKKKSDTPAMTGESQTSRL